MENERFSCDCLKCQNACMTKPGWFLPDEAEKASEFLDLSMQDFFDNYLAVDWFTKEDLYVLSPAATKNQSGEMWPYNPKGKCVFFENGKCKIHQYAPFECRTLNHDEPVEKLIERHKEIAFAWKGKEKYLENLLGYAPYPPEPEDFSEMFGMW